MYELRAGVKRTRWAVALNGFPIYTLDSNGRTFALVDIVVGEPPAEFVTPPANAKPGDALHHLPVGIEEFDGRADRTSAAGRPLPSIVDDVRDR